METSKKLTKLIHESKLPSFEKNALMEAVSLLTAKEKEDLYNSVSQNKNLLVELSKNIQSKIDYLVGENDVYSVSESDEKLESLM